ncbi:hypothetical protein EDB86DRAFT_3169593 [Lactarius hatsudake]|nr:hypothetical protein EDB86DRAFT_3169593 [Lactarius hatsudake]
MSSLRRPPFDPSPGLSPVQGQSRENPSVRSSMGPAARHSAAAAQADAIDQWFENCYRCEFHAEIAAASLDVDLKEGTQYHREMVQCSPKQSAQPLFTVYYNSTDPILHHRPATNGQGRLHDCSFEPGSMQSQMEEAQLASTNLKSPRLKSTIPDSLSAGTFNTSATNRQSFAFDTSSSFLSPHIADTVDYSSDAAATLAQ